MYTRNDLYFVLFMLMALGYNNGNCPLILCNQCVLIVKCHVSVTACLLAILKEQ